MKKSKTISEAYIEVLSQNNGKIISERVVTKRVQQEPQQLAGPGGPTAPTAPTAPSQPAASSQPTSSNQNLKPGFFGSLADKIHSMGPQGRQQISQGTHVTQQPGYKSALPSAPSAMTIAKTIPAVAPIAAVADAASKIYSTAEEQQA